MTQTDRERVLVSVLIAVILHAAVAGLIAVVGVSVVAYPESSPVVVTLPDYAAPVVEPEPEPELSSIQESSPSSEPEQAQDQSRASQAPSESAEPMVQPETRQPEAQQRETQRVAAADPAPVDPEPLPWLQESGADARAADRTEDSDLFGFSDEAPSAPLDSQPVGEILVRPDENLTATERQTFESIAEANPEFLGRIDELRSALDNPAGPAPSFVDSASPNTTPLVYTDSDTDSDSGAIQWVGSGPRAALLTALPALVAADFGGRVPSILTYIIVFQVDDSGQVVPGSLIFDRSSGHTLADQKVRLAVQGWQFEAAPNAAAVTAIATLQIARDEIQ